MGNYATNDLAALVNETKVKIVPCVFARMSDNSGL